MGPGAKHVNSYECRYKGIQQCICTVGVRKLPYTTELIPRDADADSVCGNEDNNRGCEKSDAPPKVSLHLHLIKHCRAHGFDGAVMGVTSRICRRSHMQKD
jgi:hypothetical protein